MHKRKCLDDGESYSKKRRRVHSEDEFDDAVQSMKRKIEQQLVGTSRLPRVLATMCIQQLAMTDTTVTATLHQYGGEKVDLDAWRSEVNNKVVYFFNPPTIFDKPEPFDQTIYIKFVKYLENETIPKVVFTKLEKVVIEANDIYHVDWDLDFDDDNDDDPLDDIDRLKYRNVEGKYKAFGGFVLHVVHHDKNFITLESITLP
jgi:hypothetical protein